MKLDILAFGAHPDDVELSCGGTLLKHLKLGKTAGLIDLTRGELGTRGTADIRDAEAKAAASILGASVRENLNLADGYFQNDPVHQLKVITIIRKYQPEIILCNAVNDRHPDHGKAARLVADASFYAGLVKIETMFDSKKQEAWRAKVVYHYIQDHYIRPDFVIDITEFMEKKMEAVQAFRSQFYDPSSKEPSTPISTKEFLDFTYSRATEMGRPIHVKYAEGFTVERIPAVHSLFDLL